MIKYIRQFVNTIGTFFDVPSFIRENQLWRGFVNHKLVVFALLVAGAIFSWHIIGLADKWWSNLHVEDPLEAGLQATYLVRDIAVGSYEFMFAGAYKYIVLIIMEMVIFHMTLKTNSILDGSTTDLSPGIFFHAQLRMIKVSIFTFVMELIVSIILKMILSIMGLDFLKAILLFLTQCFFLGFAMVDNYNEIHNLPIRESYKHTLNFAGVAVGIGLIMYILILIPIIGPFAGPLVGAIAATLIMHELEGGSTEEIMV